MTVATKRRSRRLPTAAGAVFTALLLLPAGTAAQEAGTIARFAEQSAERAAPVILAGHAQIVPAFQDSTEWIGHHLWVETEFDSDGDGRPDRVHVAVARPAQTDTEGLRVPVIYESSPYYSGVGSAAQEYFWNVRHELGAEPPERNPNP